MYERHLPQSHKRCLLRLSLVLLVVCALFGVTSSAVLASPQVIMVLWHQLSWEQIDTDHRLFDEEFGIGLLNTRPGGGATIEGAYLSLGSGARAIGVAGAARVYMGDEVVRGEEVTSQYVRRTGETPSTILHPGLALLQTAAAQASYPLQVGALGEILYQGGVSVGAYGNSDTADEVARFAPLVAMDALGRVPFGYIGSDVTLLNTVSSFGRQTDYGRLLATIDAEQPQFLVVDLGDPYRLSRYQTHLLPEQYHAQEQRLVEWAWDFVASIRAAYPQALLMVVSAYPGDGKARLGQWLTPMLLFGSGQGLLTSATTRWPGIVTNMDVAPTVLSAFGLQERNMIGRRIRLESDKTQNSLETVQQLEIRLVDVARLRGTVLRLLVGLQILLYLIALGLLVSPLRLAKPGIWWFRLGLLVVLSLPLVLLLWAQAWWWGFVPLVGLMAAYLWARRATDPILILCLATALVLAVDIVTGFSLIRYSYLGYDAAGGARFYGIGNEYMGVLIGSLIIGWTLWRERWSMRWERYVDMGVFGVATIVIAAPSLGTNVGGAITAIVGFGVAWIGLHRLPLRPRSLILLLVVVAVVVIGLMGLDSLRSEEQQSHMGQTVLALRQDGPQAIVMIAQRKISMNLRLFRYSFWSRGLVVALLTMTASLIWPNTFLRWLRSNHPRLTQGIVATLVASITAMVVNDSGVVAASTCLLFAATTMLYLAVSLKHDFVAAQADIE